MLQPLLELYERFESASAKFTEAGLSAISFIDVYRGQPLDPAMYDYFSLPAVFVDYTMVGLGQNQPRRITMTLHIVTDDLPDAANISEKKDDGLKRFLYLLLIQTILEGYKLGKTTGLKFLSENPIDIPVVNYHSQTYEFDAYPLDMIGDIVKLYGIFDTLKIYGKLRKNL
jgi:hypothetical protein